MFEQKRLGDNGTSAATSKESGDRGDEMDEKDGQVAHLAIVPISTSVTRLGTRRGTNREFATDRCQILKSWRGELDTWTTELKGTAQFGRFSGANGKVW